MEGKRTVCVTGASGYIGSWLVMRLLERRYHVRATVRDPAYTHTNNTDLVFLNSVLKLLPSTSGNEKKVKHLSELPNANTHLTLWKADLAEESSYDDAFHGCEGVFHMASPMELLVHDQATKYLAEKTVAEKAAWKYAEENGIDMVTVHPSLVFGHFITPYTGYSIDIAISLYTKDKATMASLICLNGTSVVHVDDVCNAHIYLFEHPLAKGRYICSTHTLNIFDIAHSLSLKYPNRDIQTEFESLDKSPKIIPCSSKKLMDIGFEFAHGTKSTGDLCAETIESCREKGLL
ncbi:hypothetical protein AgCh_005084 [Apium graveolens]